MSYTISKTDGTTLVTLLDGTTNSDTGITLIGRNSTNFGDAQNENFVRLLENFADPLPPGQSVGFSPIAGTLWWDTIAQKIKVYTGSSWVPTSERYVDSVAPSGKLGDQWYNTATNQLFSYDGVGWGLIGPGYTSQQGKSGSIVETIVDSLNQTHTVVNTYTNGKLIGISSADPVFTPQVPYSGFNQIQPGINLLSNVVMNATVRNSISVGGVYANVLARTDAVVNFSSDVRVAGTLALPSANVYVSGTTLGIKNTAFNGNIDFYINSYGNTLRPLFIDGASGAVNVGTPINYYNVAHKGYVDSQAQSAQSRIEDTNQSIISNIAQVNSSFSIALAASNSAQTANLLAVQTSINGNVSVLANTTGSALATLYSNEINIQTQLSAIENTIANLAAIQDPGLIGEVTINGNLAANLSYVNSSTQSINNNLTTIINGLASSAQANLVNSTSTLAPKNSPTFTGTPQTPTALFGNSSTQVASTGFVHQAVNAAKFNYTVSSAAPSGGNNGDFWFQTG